jgi:hypothetical protein
MSQSCKHIHNTQYNTSFSFFLNNIILYSNRYITKPVQNQLQYIPQRFEFSLPSFCRLPSTTQTLLTSSLVTEVHSVLYTASLCTLYPLCHCRREEEHAEPGTQQGTTVCMVGRQYIIYGTRISLYLSSAAKHRFLAR